MPALTAEVLRTLQACEELLDELPPQDRARGSLTGLCQELRALHADISQSNDRSNDRVRATLATCDAAWQTMEGVRARVGLRREPA